MKLVKNERQNGKDTLYGRDFGKTRVALSANDYARQAMPSLIKMELSKVYLPERRDVIIYTYQSASGIHTEIRELETTREDEHFELESKMLESYEIVLKMKDIRQIKTRKFLEEIKNRLVADERYAYKKFLTQCLKNTDFNVHIYHIFVIYIATVLLLNSLDFVAPLHLQMMEQRGKLLLGFKSKSNDRLEIMTKDKLKQIPRTEALLAYIGALCRADNINSTFEIINNQAIIEYEIPSITIDATRVYSKETDENLMFAELMDIFNGREIEEEEEE